LIFGERTYQDRRVLELLVLLARAIALVCRGHQDIVLENLALRHQLRTLQRSVKRPHLRTGDRLVWVVLATAWRQWRSALVLVQPATVVRWHRDWLRRRWARRSGRNRAGRPALDPKISRLITDITSPEKIIVWSSVHAPKPQFKWRCKAPRPPRLVSRPTKGRGGADEGVLGEAQGRAEEVAASCRRTPLSN